MRWKAVAMWGALAGVYIHVSFSLIVYDRLEPVGFPGSLAFRVLYALVLGWLIVWLYALMEARWGSSLKSRLGAGIGGWGVHALLAVSGIADMGPDPLSGFVLGYALLDLAFVGVLVGIAYDY